MTPPEKLLEVTECGLRCPAGDFFVDPWRPVKRAVITHAHADHGRPGSHEYLVARPGLELLRARLGDSVRIETLDYGEPVNLGGVRVSFHPAGHILGSAQVRVEHRGEIWVVSGDYKLGPDPTCTPFEPVRCHTFISECTFGLPVFHWPAPEVVLGQIRAWWKSNRQEGRSSLLFAYTLGKAQRLLSGLRELEHPIFTHGAVERMTQVYRQAGVELERTTHVSEADPRIDWSRALILAPPHAAGSPWLRRFGSISTGFASGWMSIRGTRRRRAVDRGFVLSDHCDWDGLMAVIESTRAERILLTHGYVEPVVRWLREKGLFAEALPILNQGGTLRE